MLDLNFIEQIAITSIAELKNYFLISVTQNKNNIKVIYDADGSGVSIDELARINRKIRNAMEENNFYKEGNFSLEVTSYGLDNPIILKRQYQKFIGKSLDITLNDNTTKESILLEITDKFINVETIKNKKEKIQEQILLENIKHTYKTIKI